MSMTMNRFGKSWRPLAIATGLAMLGLMATTSVASGGGAELIGSLGATRAVGSGSDNARIFFGAAVRAPIVPALKAEVGVAYRQQDYSILDGDLKVRQWPITGSLWLSPLPVLYAGGGVGWYMTTYDSHTTLLENTTTQQQFGAHLGGGLDVPVAPNLGIDLNGRYVWMKKNSDDPFPSDDVNPDFWTTSIGLALKF